MITKLIPLVALLVLVPTAVFALDASTDKTDYIWNETIQITGNVEPTNSTDIVDVWILHKNTWYAHQQVTQINGTFTTLITLLPEWAGDGTYTARVDYNGVQFKTPFNILTMDPEPGAAPVVEPEPEQVVPPIDSMVTEPEVQEPIVNATITEQPFVNATVTTSSNTTSEPVTNQTAVEPTIEPPVQVPQEIPSWIKGVFVYWANGQISDDELIDAIRFLVNNGVIDL